jgi:von Willebrand factor type A domain
MSPDSTEHRRWWRIADQEWYKLVMAALALVASAFGVFFAVRQVWPQSAPPEPVKNNYEILVDRSESMGAMLGARTKLQHVADTVRDNVGASDTDGTARGLSYFGGGCGQIEERVGLDPDNAPDLKAALDHPPPTGGKRPLIQALDDAVARLANLPVQLGQGDVKTVRRIVVFTDGPDECNDDLSRVTTSLDQSAIQLEFHIVGVDLTPDDRQLLNDLAQSLPGVGGKPAEVTGELPDDVLPTTTTRPTATTGRGATTPASTTTISTTTTTTAPTTTRR